MPGAIILINGFPGVGKHTIAQELARILPHCKVLDTRHLSAAASQVHDPGDAHKHLCKRLTLTLLDSLTSATSPTPTTPTQPPPPTYILTSFLTVRPTDRGTMHEFVDTAQRAGFAFIHLIITCGTEENVRRLERRGSTSTSLSTSTSTGGVVNGGVERGNLTTTAHTGVDAGGLLQIRMEEEITPLGPLAGLAGEYEIETSGMDARTAAGVLGEYCLDTLRSQGWWIQLNAGKGAIGRGVGTNGGNGGDEDEESDKVGSLRASMVTSVKRRASMSSSVSTGSSSESTSKNMAAHAAATATSAPPSAPTRSKLVSFSLGKKKS